MVEPLLYAGVGARATPGGILAQMAPVARDLASQGWTLRSGGAGGADAAFAGGAPVEGRQIFVPWPGYRGAPGDARALTRDEIAAGERIAAEAHPAWERCTRAVRQLHARNVAVILGPELDAPVAAVVCWTEQGREIGGTGVAIRIARAHDIPVYNMASLDRREIVERMAARAAGVPIEFPSRHPGFAWLDGLATGGVAPERMAETLLGRFRPGGLDAERLLATGERPLVLVAGENAGADASRVGAMLETLRGALRAGAVPGAADLAAAGDMSVKQGAAARRLASERSRPMSDTYSDEQDAGARGIDGYAEDREDAIAGRAAREGGESSFVAAMDEARLYGVTRTDPGELDNRAAFDPERAMDAASRIMNILHTELFPQDTRAGDLAEEVSWGIVHAVDRAYRENLGMARAAGAEVRQNARETLREDPTGYAADRGVNRAEVLADMAEAALAVSTRLQDAHFELTGRVWSPRSGTPAARAGGATHGFEVEAGALERRLDRLRAPAEPQRNAYGVIVSGAQKSEDQPDHELVFATLDRLKREHPELHVVYPGGKHATGELVRMWLQFPSNADVTSDAVAYKPDHGRRNYGEAAKKRDEEMLAVPNVREAYFIGGDPMGTFRKTAARLGVHIHATIDGAAPARAPRPALVDPSELRDAARELRAQWMAEFAPILRPGLPAPLETVTGARAIAMHGKALELEGAIERRLTASFDPPDSTEARESLGEALRRMKPILDPARCRVEAIDKANDLVGKVKTFAGLADKLGEALDLGQDPRAAVRVFDKVPAAGEKLYAALEKTHPELLDHALAQDGVARALGRGDKPDTRVELMAAVDRCREDFHVAAILTRPDPEPKDLARAFEATWREARSLPNPDWTRAGQALENRLDRLSTACFANGRDVELVETGAYREWREAGRERSRAEAVSMGADEAARSPAHRMRA